MAHTWEKEIAIDPLEGPYIIWHKIEPLSEKVLERIEELKLVPSPDGAPWKMRE